MLWIGLCNGIRLHYQWRHADVAELVDARDLKSLSYGYPGSIPGVRTTASYFASMKSLSSYRMSYAQQCVEPFAPHGRV